MSTEPATLIRNALVFDGSGCPPRVEDVLLAGRCIAARAAGMSCPTGARELDARGLWLMPGLLDIHTHLDLELELEPGMPESVRHGTTTVVVGNCSLGTAFGAQRRDGEDPILDCFARVENVPKSLLRRIVDRIDWDSTAGYLAHLASLPLGPNVVPLIPYSMLRIEAMGTRAAVSRPPTGDELKRMVELLDAAMEQGYAGFSTDSIPFHYLANEPFTDRKIPAHHASHQELRTMLDVVRRHGRVWQCTPDSSHRVASIGRFLLTSGRLYGRPLKTSALTAIDLTHDRNTWRLFPLVTAVLNSRLLDGRLHFQVLATPFRMYAEGSVCPIFEEFSSTRRLMACDIDDAAGRRRVLSSSSFTETFVREWHDRGRVLTFNRDLGTMFVESCPVPQWTGESFAAIQARMRAFQAGERGVARSAAERRELEAFPAGTARDAEFVLHLLRRFDRALRWWFVVGNDRPEILRRLLFHPHMLPGFNDSGAHLINLAFFDGNLLTLQMAARESQDRVATAVRRLTRDPAAFFGVDAGTLDIGAQADVVLVDPDELRVYDTDTRRTRVVRPALGHEQLVNRSDGVVRRVFIAGHEVWDGRAVTPTLGRERLGRPLTN